MSVKRIYAGEKEEARGRGWAEPRLSGAAKGWIGKIKQARSSEDRLFTAGAGSCGAKGSGGWGLVGMKTQAYCNEASWQPSQGNTLGKI